VHRAACITALLRCTIPESHAVKLTRVNERGLIDPPRILWPPKPRPSTVVPIAQTVPSFYAQRCTVYELLKSVFTLSYMYGVHVIV